MRYFCHLHKPNTSEGVANADNPCWVCDTTDPNKPLQPTPDYDDVDVIQLCDCEDYKQATGKHVIHVYDPSQGCQADGPDTRAEDDLGEDWCLGFPHKCM